MEGELQLCPRGKLREACIWPACTLRGRWFLPTVDIKVANEANLFASLSDAFSLIPCPLFAFLSSAVTFILAPSQALLIPPGILCTTTPAFGTPMATPRLEHRWPRSSTPEKMGPRKCTYSSQWGGSTWRVGRGRTTSWSGARKGSFRFACIEKIQLATCTG